MAWVEHLTDYPSKAGAYLTERLKDPTSPALPEEIRLLDAKGEHHDWRANETADAHRARNFVRRSLGSDAASQYGLHMFLQATALKEAKADAKVIGLGFDSGQIICDIAKVYPDPTYIVCDFSDHFEDPKTLFQMWHADQDQVKVGRITLQANTNTSALSDAAVFVIATHFTWSDEYLLKKLTEIRHAATKDTLLVIGSHISPNADNATGTANPTIILSELMSSIDVSLMAWSNGKLRYFESVKEMLKQSGWKVTDVHAHFPYLAAQASPV